MKRALSHVLVLGSLLAAPSGAQTVRCSVDEAGAQLWTNAQVAAVSADGSRVVMDLASIYPPFPHSLRLYDRATGTSALLALAPGGTAPNGFVDSAALSSDGSRLIFTSSATNLGPVDANAGPDVYVHDFATGANLLVTTLPNGVAAGFSGNPQISPDGRYAAFRSYSTGFLPGDTTPSFADLYVKDLQTNTTVRVSVNSQGAQANYGAEAFDMSGDGRFVAFESFATNLDGSESDDRYDVFVHDRVAHVTERVSSGLSGAPGNDDSYAPSISDDGRFVVFWSHASDLVANDTNGLVDVFLRDRLLATTTRLSVGPGGTQADGNSAQPSISGDGRRVAYMTNARNIVPGFAEPTQKVAVCELASGRTTIESVTPTGADAGTGHSAPALSRDGRTLVFQSFSPNLVFGDTNNSIDAFLRALPAPSGAAFCRGDDVQATCPCANPSPSAADAGCLNSLGVGASLAATGGGSLSADTLVLDASGMPDSTALVFQGTTAGAGAAFGDGVRCATGTIVRLATRTVVGGALQYPVAGDPTLSAAGSVLAPGVRTYQVWYRNAATFCTPSTFNLSNGWRVDWEA